VVCGAGARGASVAASGTVPMGGLFGAVLSTPVGALIVSCEGSFCAEAMLKVMKSVAATNWRSALISPRWSQAIGAPRLAARQGV
jgi:hypothetical protein